VVDFIVVERQVVLQHSARISKLRNSSTEAYSNSYPQSCGVNSESAKGLSPQHKWFAILESKKGHLQARKRLRPHDPLMMSQTTKI
jgi:hypothetical protein